MSLRADRLRRKTQESIRGGQLGAALDLSVSWIHEDPADIDAYYWHSLIQFQFKNYGVALSTIEKVLELGEADPRLLTQLGKCQLKLGREVDARLSADRAVVLNPIDADLLDALGVIYSHLGEHQLALPLYKKAAECSPKNPQYFYNLGSALNYCNRPEKAEEAYRECISLNPKNYRAYWSLSQLKKQNLECNNLAELKPLLGTSDIPKLGEVYVSLAMAKEYEDLGLYEESFSYLKRGNDIANDLMPYDSTKDNELYSIIQSVFNTEFCRQGIAQDMSVMPIFIVGMPRTGTTLVEQILACCEGVYAAGETSNLERQLMRLCQSHSDESDSDNVLKYATELDYKELGRSYVDNMQHRVGSRAVFTDKMPMNFRYVGAISMAIPNAKIIHLKRHPMDTCYSNYKQLFKLGACRYSYNLIDMGEYYEKYHALMVHWHNVFPGRILDVEYENLVANFETESRRLVGFCELDWTDRCLEFHKIGAAVATASSTQVRKPLYKTSVGKWKCYQKQLVPLKKQLERDGICAD